MGAQESAVICHTPQHYLDRRAFITAMAPMKMKSAGKSTVMTKSALAAAIAEACEVKNRVASTALATLASVGGEQLKKAGKFVIPGLAMIKTRKKPATKAKKMLMFGEMKLVKAKPAKTVVKAFAAKAIKDQF